MRLDASRESLKRGFWWILIPCVLAVVFAYVRPSPAWWDPDSVIYTRMMLADAHAPQGQAFRIDRGTDYFRSQAHRNSLEHMFEGRVLYPWLASLLYPGRGLQAMLDVSRVAYILASCIVFVLVAQFAGPMIGSLCASAFAVWPSFREMANGADSYMLSLLLWSALILAAVVAAQKGSWLSIAAFAVLTVALSATRPAVYYPLLAVGAVAAVRRDVASYRLVAVAFLITLAYGAVSMIAGLPGLAEHLDWVHGRAQELRPDTNPSPLIWWLEACRDVAVRQVKTAVRLVYPVAIVLAAVLGMWLKRESLSSALLVGTLVASILSVAADPVQWDFYWIFEAPLAPILLIGIGLLVNQIISNLKPRASRRGTFA